LLETASVEPESDVRYELVFDRGGRQARVRLEAASIRNPFGKTLLQRFRCS
jgi:type VI protein secretion system component VasK